MAISQGLKVFSLTGSETAISVSIFSISSLFAILLLLSVPVYIAWSLVVMRRARLALPSPAQSSRFRWIWSFIAGL